MSTVKLQVPMDKTIKDGLDKKAKDLGFDSAQAYIRFWAKAQTDGRSYYLGEPEQITPKLEKLLQTAEAEINNGNTVGPFKNVNDAISYLDKNSKKPKAKKKKREP